MPAPTRIPRRSFLRSLAAGGLALPALSMPGRLIAQEILPNGRKLGIALCGLGGYSRGQLGPALRETKLCRLAGVVTGSREKGGQWSREYGFSDKAVYSYETMARLADNPETDIVYVVTPNSLHAENVIAAARAGEHVICEKPMANSVAECDSMLVACRAAKVKLSIGCRLHFDPHHREMKRLAREKDFGAFDRMDSLSYNQSGNRFRAAGAGGWIQLDPAFSYRGIKTTTSRGSLDFPPFNQQAAQMDEFAACVAAGRESIVAGEMGRRDLVITEAIYEAARTGKRVEPTKR